MTVAAEQGFGEVAAAHAELTCDARTLEQQRAEKHAAQCQLAEQIAQERAHRNAERARQRAELADDLKLLTGR